MAQVEFRDGTREVPDHLADLMIGLDTYKLTYAQATVQANQKPTRDYLNNVQQKMLDASLKRR